MKNTFEWGVVTDIISPDGKKDRGVTFHSPDKRVAIHHALDTAGTLVRVQVVKP